MNKNNIKDLKKHAGIARKLILDMVYLAKSGHIGGSLSIIDVLVFLYFNHMNIDPKNPKLFNRDRLVLSKGHACPALYSVLALKGYFNIEELRNFRKIDSFLQGHPDCLKIPGIDASTGSLGQGASISCGIALSSKINKENYNVYTIIGDGELQEGQVWESAMFASHYKLNNLTYIIDNNNLQIDGKIDEVMNVYPIEEKFKSFGFNVLTTDGHDFEQIEESFNNKNLDTNKPTAIILKTIKGCGIKSMENNPDWHGNAPNFSEYEIAIKELENRN